MIAVEAEDDKPKLRFCDLECCQTCARLRPGRAPNGAGVMLCSRSVIQPVPVNPLHWCLDYKRNEGEMELPVVS